MAVSDTTTSTPLLINGEERETADSFAVHDPHDGSVIGHAASASAAGRAGCGRCGPGGLASVGGDPRR